MIMDKDLIQSCFDDNRLDEVMALLGDSDDAWSLYMKGRVAWKQGRRSEAISLYCRASALDPSGPATVALDQARTIMDFYNKDMYNQ